MEFKETKSIFKQIADRICDRIISEELKPGDRVESVRELAAQIGVNQNTILKTYTDLQQNEIIQNQRGIGYFVTEQAMNVLTNRRKTDFFNEVVPEFIKQAKLLNLTNADLLPILEQLNTETHEN